MISRQSKFDGTAPGIPKTSHQGELIASQSIDSCVRFAADCGVTAVCLPAYGRELYKLSEAERFPLLEATGDPTMVYLKEPNPLLHAPDWPTWSETLFSFHRARMATQMDDFLHAFCFWLSSSCQAMC